MTTRETTAILTTREALIPHIEADMIEQTGQVIPYVWTGTIIFASSRVWHEFSINNGETLLYAFLNDNDYVTILQDADIDEVKRFND